MRRIIALGLASTLLLLGACSSTPDEQPPGPLDELVVEDIDPGEEPYIELTEPLDLTENAYRVLAAGDGEELDPRRVIQLNYVAVKGTDGSLLTSTYGEAPELVRLGDEELLPEMSKALDEVRVGGRFLLGMPPNSSMAEEYSSLLIVEVAGTLPGRAEGTPVAPTEGLPGVSVGADGKPWLDEAPAGDPPAELVAQTLIVGSGPAIEPGQRVTAHYTGWLWDGTVFDSSWETGRILQFALGKDEVIEGWDQGLAGQTVGSQVMLAIPPSLGYGDEATARIPAGSTLIYVIDILDAS